MTGLAIYLHAITIVSPLWLLRKRQASRAVPKWVTARHAKCSFCCKALAGALHLILCTIFPKRYWPEVFHGLCGQVERKTEREVWKKYPGMITLCSDNHVKRSEEWCHASYIFLFMDFCSIYELNKLFLLFQSKAKIIWVFNG